MYAASEADRAASKPVPGRSAAIGIPRYIDKRAVDVRRENPASCKRLSGCPSTDDVLPVVERSGHQEAVAGIGVYVQVVCERAVFARG